LVPLLDPLLLRVISLALLQALVFLILSALKTLPLLLLLRAELFLALLVFPLWLCVP
jgi:hypothetical protein